MSDNTHDLYLNNQLRHFWKFLEEDLTEEDLATSKLLLQQEVSNDYDDLEVLIDEMYKNSQRLAKYGQQGVESSPPELV